MYFQLTTLSLLRFVGIVETVVVAITDVDPRDAVTVVAGEEVAVARPVGGRALIGWLVLASFAVAVSVAVPRGRDTAMIRTSAIEK
jgi:hypothetical protein